MSDALATALPAQETGVPHATDTGGHAHPRPYQYVIIAVILCVITALEVGASYLEGDVSDTLLIVMLLVMAAVKFFLVVSWFMHLRTDSPAFRWVFIGGLVLAPIVFLITLLILHVYGT